MTALSYDVTSLGEAMLRFSVPPGQRLEAAARLDVFTGGAECNVTAALAQLGRRSAWFGALPDQPLGRLAANRLRQAGVDLTGVVWCRGGRMGTYYIEFGAAPRATQVYYDRAGSCAAQLAADELDWYRLLSTRVLHLTGITPALSPQCRALTETAVARARDAGVRLSFDINYRQKLWSEREAASTLAPLVQGAAVLFCSQADAARLFGLSGSPEAVLHGLAELSQARLVVLTLAHEGAAAWDGEHLWRQPALPVEIIDRLGAGDALAAGVLHGWLDGDVARGLRWGTALAAIALSQFGDMLITSPAEVEAVLNNPASHLQR